MTTRIPADVYGEPAIYICRCRWAHGVHHVCALCRATQEATPTEPWVPSERCYICLTETEQRLLGDLAVVRRKLEVHAVMPVDGVTGEKIPPLFLTAKGWQP